MYHIQCKYSKCDNYLTFYILLPSSTPAMESLYLPSGPPGKDWGHIFSQGISMLRLQITMLPDLPHLWAAPETTKNKVRFTLRT